MPGYVGPNGQWIQTADVPQGGAFNLAVAQAIGGFKRAEASTLRGLGNSFDAYQGASAPAKAYQQIVAARKGWALTNLAVSGACLWQYADAQFGSAVVGAGDNWVGSFGLNDLRYYGPAPIKLKQFEDGLYAALAFLAIPDANKVFFSDNSGGFTTHAAAVTYLPNTAAWTFSPVFKGTAVATRMGSITTTNGASVTCVTPPGDSLIIWFGQNATVNGFSQVIVDGVTYGNGQQSTAPYADSPGTAGSWMLGCLRIGGLAKTAHTVQVKSVSANLLVPCALACYDSASLVGANVYVLGVPPLAAAGWAVAPAFNGSAQATTDGQSVYFYETAGAFAWNLRIKGVCDRLKSEGLNVNYVDGYSVWNAAGVAGDNLHPDDTNHFNWATATLRVINAT